MGKLLNILLGFDQLANTILACLPWPFSWPGVGFPDETISSTLGKLKQTYGGKIPWRWPFAKLLDWCCNQVDSDHSIDAIEEDEGESSTPTKHNLEGI
jgi:hypothetical protein